MFTLLTALTLTAVMAPVIGWAALVLAVFLLALFVVAVATGRTAEPTPQRAPVTAARVADVPG
ncbi:hypothetical protein [Cellulomonas fimi]|uniref:hypothetical protein n=1 Tax=Cellulomonas fimi TaxID=1708 RepID=UPI00235905B0|nr:hypothetical protein [Cellulomonas fimi]